MSNELGKTSEVIQWSHVFISVRESTAMQEQIAAYMYYTAVGILLC